MKKLNKKCLVVLMGMIFLVQMNLPYLSAAEIPNDMQQAYEEIGVIDSNWKFFSIDQYDVDVWNNYRVLVMKMPGSFPSKLANIKEPDGGGNDYNPVAREYRYVGMTPLGHLVNNPKYPEDHAGTAIINTYKWQSNADRITQLDNYFTSSEDAEFYKSEIFYFLKQEYGTRFDATDDVQKWIDNAIVIVPATSTGYGVIKFMHKWDSNKDGLAEDWYITVNLRSKNEANADLIAGSTTTTGTTTQTTSGLVTLGRLKIAADSTSGIEKFDVTQGIPTSEALETRIEASEYIHSESYENIKGSISYKVTVNKTYTLWKWDETTSTWESKDESVSKEYDIQRHYSFYLIDELEVYTLNHAQIHNAALPSGKVVLMSKSKAPTIDMDRDTVEENHYIFPLSGTTHTVNRSDDLGKDKKNTTYQAVPNEDLSYIAESSVGAVRVKNDRLVFNGTVLMNDTWHDASSPNPTAIPNAPLSHVNDLYKNNLMIPNTVTNGVKTSTGTLNYTVVENTGSETSYTTPITGLNNVVVHTPVVCYPKITEDPSYIQVIDKNTTVQNLVVDRAFSIEFPNVGQHITAKGYGNSDYEKYIGSKQVKFNFDVYVGPDKKGTYIAANTWYTLDKTLDVYSFYIPHWVGEGTGEVLFRVLPINDIGDANAVEFKANKDRSHYRAVERINLELVGQLYDFQVTGTTEKDYSNMFLNTDGSNKGTVYYVGNKDNYATEDLSRVNTLPVMPGKNTNVGYLKMALKKGSAFYYSIKTVGNMQNKNDFAILLPKFYYVDYAGKNRQEIDIWYEDGGLKKMATYGFDISTSINNIYTNISKTDIDHTSNYYFTDYYSGTRTKSNYQTWYLNDDTKVSKKIGTSSLVALDYEQRLYVGSTSNLPSGVSVESAKKGVQKYIGAYFIPNTSRALPKGDNKLANELKNGYIVVNFELYTIPNFSGNTTDYHLSYFDGASANMFSIENFVRTQGVFTLSYGDVAFYDLNKSTETDYTIRGIY